MEQHLSTLVAAIRALSTGGPPPQSSSLPRPKPAKSRVPLLAAIGAAVALLAGAGVYAWSPWQPAWQRSPAAFLDGSWCQPMSGTAIMRADYKRSGGDTVNGEIRFSHSTDVIRFRAKVAAIAEGIEYSLL